MRLLSKIHSVLLRESLCHQIGIENMYCTIRMKIILNSPLSFNLFRTRAKFCKTSYIIFRNSLQFLIHDFYPLRVILTGNFLLVRYGVIIFPTSYDRIDSEEEVWVPVWCLRILCRTPYVWKVSSQFFPLRFRFILHTDKVCFHPVPLSAGCIRCLWNYFIYYTGRILFCFKILDIALYGFTMLQFRASFDTYLHQSNILRYYSPFNYGMNTLEASNELQPNNITSCPRGVKFSASMVCFSWKQYVCIQIPSSCWSKAWY